MAILGSRNATDELAAVVELFESGTVDPRALVTHRVSLDEAPAMLGQWAAAPQAVGKILVSVGESRVQGAGIDDGVSLQAPR